MLCLCCHSGYCLYRSNSTSHSATEIGGNDPCSFQSVIDNPERVSRVIPPTVTIPATSPLIPNNQYATGRLEVDDLVASCTTCVETVDINRDRGVVLEA